MIEHTSSYWLIEDLSEIWFYILPWVTNGHFYLTSINRDTVFLDTVPWHCLKKRFLEIASVFWVLPQMLNSNLNNCNKKSQNNFTSDLLPTELFPGTDILHIETQWEKIDFLFSYVLQHLRRNVFTKWILIY